MKNAAVVFLACSVIMSLGNVVDVSSAEGPIKHSIKRTGYFPTEAQIDKGCFLKNVKPLCTDGRQYIFVPDWNYATVYRFNLAGQLEGFFGKKGQGPNEFRYINSIASFSEGLVILDSGNMRISVLEVDGRLVDSFRIFKAYTDMAVSLDGSQVFVASRSLETKLIDILGRDGKLLASFG